MLFRRVSKHDPFHSLFEKHVFARPPSLGSQNVWPTMNHSSGTRPVFCLTWAMVVIRPGQKGRTTRMACCEGVSPPRPAVLPRPKKVTYVESRGSIIDRVAVKFELSGSIHMLGIHALHPKRAK